jgi:hypothetical protein
LAVYSIFTISVQPERANRNGPLPTRQFATTDHNFTRLKQGREQRQRERLARKVIGLEPASPRNSRE